MNIKLSLYFLYISSPILNDNGPSLICRFNHNVVINAFNASFSEVIRLCLIEYSPGLKQEKMSCSTSRQNVSIDESWEEEKYSEFTQSF